MRRTATALATALTAVALTTLTGASPPVPASPPTPTARAAALPGFICFWPEPGETGQGGGWCYDPGRGGYNEPEQRIRRHAKSFSNQTQQQAYALHFPSSGPCLKRRIYSGDYSENWEWWDKFDAIDTNDHSDCQPG